MNSNNLLKTVLKPPRRPMTTSDQANVSNHHNNDSLDFSALNWTEFFEESRDIQVSKSNGKFRVYLNGFKRNEESNSPCILLLHGGGYSSLTWSLFVRSINELCDCKIIAIDIRGHGSTETQNDLDLSMNTLVDDIFNVMMCLFDENHSDIPDENVISKRERTNVNDEEVTMDDIAYEPIKEQIQLPPLCICGHSMGGALAVHASYKLSTVCTITGLIVIDVVEGTALDALQGMHLVLKNRQSSFNSITEAIEWCVRNGQTRNIEAARISFPGQIKNRLTNKTATDEYEADPNSSSRTTNRSTINSISDQCANFSLESLKNKCVISSDTIEEEDDEKMDAEYSSQEFRKPNTQPSFSEGKYVWRVNLFKSEPYWQGWFQNLSTLFLGAPTSGRLLLLAGIDRLDKVLTIGQMQGKFQMQVLPQCGHAVHEDVPEKVAEAIATYLIRNKLVQKKKDFNSTFPCC